MSENSNIEWCDHTFNPWIGCTKVAPGCANCYAEAQRMRFGKDEWGPGKARTRTSEASWNKVRKWNRQAQCNCGAAGAGGRECEWCANGCKRPRVFCASLADVFEDRGDLDEWRNDLFALIRETPHLDWLLLTKRPDVAREWLCEEYQGYSLRGDPDYANPPYPNLWLGYSVACRKDLEGVRHLRAAPAAVRFLSIEPLLEAVDLTPWLECRCDKDGNCDVCLSGGLDWVITGGESGPNARPCDVAWIRGIVEQCKAADVRVFVKQLGAKPYELVENYACDDDTCQRCGGRGEIVTCPDDMCYGQEECIHGDGYSTCPDCGGDGREDTRVREPLNLNDRKGGDPSEWPEDLRVRQFPGAKS
jgi:protein gp37